MTLPDRRAGDTRHPDVEVGPCVGPCTAKHASDDAGQSLPAARLTHVLSSATTKPPVSIPST
jgi:hypothetical protein